jgi:predicted N-formylglutamate amidohydrolase
VAKREWAVLFTCEHGGNRVPREFRATLAGTARLRASHRGWDRGALAVARRLASALQAPLIAATTTRLLVDLNRSPHNPAVFSDATRRLSREERQRLLHRYHHPHWDRVRGAISLPNRLTLHVAVHSFTPVFQGRKRAFALGLLYDPARPRERAFAGAWQTRLREHLPRAVVRRNAPYRGDSDGLTTRLRRDFSGDRYLGIELEVNQRLLATPAGLRELVPVLACTLEQTASRACGPERVGR